MIVALGSSLLYIAWVASIRNADQIGQLAFATIIVGGSCAFASLMLALSMIRAMRRRAEVAVVGGHGHHKGWLTRIEVLRVGERAWRDHTHHFAADEPLGLLGQSTSGCYAVNKPIDFLKQSSGRCTVGAIGGSPEIDHGIPATGDGIQGGF